MRITRSLFFVASVVVAGSIGAAAQVTNRVQPNPAQKLTQPNDPQDYEALIREVFAPITDELKLTNEQKFKMVAIVTGTVIRADPLMNQLDELDMQIDEAAMADSFDEARIRQLCPAGRGNGSNNCDESSRQGEHVPSPDT
jgi:Spy/CpxP family protein refolding chaperone